MEHKRDFLKLVVDREAPPFSMRGLYLITDHDDHLVERVRKALGGRIAALQYRNKRKKDAAWFTVGRAIKDICAKAGIPFIVNDDPTLALELDADGVHMGQDDGDPKEARRLLGPRKIIGVSTHSLEEALRAQDDGADYIGLGAMYPTASK